MPSGFRPNRYLVDEKEFGRAADAKWKSAPTHESAQLGLAQLQHALAIRLRTDLREAVVDRLTESTGQDAHYIIRKLNGQVPVTALDLVVWAETAGVTLA